MEAIKVGVITGSLRKKSFSRCAARALTQLAPQGMGFGFVEIGDLPHYNEDLEPDPPAVFTRFREEITGADAILFVTPEFNRSLPGALKNCLDVGSRPWGKSVWGGKPAAVVSVSPGAIGGFGAHHHLRQVLMAVGAVAMPHPEAYVGGAAKLFDDQGELTDAATRDFFRQIMSAFQSWVQRQLR